jgi:hypothetical protein
MTVTQITQHLALSKRHALGFVPDRICNRGYPLLRPAGLERRRALRILLHQQCAALQLDLQILSGLVAFEQIPPPRLQMIYPGAHGEEVPAQCLRDEPRSPPIVGQGLHRHDVPFVRAVVTIEKLAVDRIVSIREHVRFHHDALPHRALDRKAAAIDLRRDPFNDDACARHVPGGELPGARNSTPSGGNRSLSE